MSEFASMRTLAIAQLSSSAKRSGLSVSQLYALNISPHTVFEEVRATIEE